MNAKKTKKQPEPSLCIPRARFRSVLDVTPEYIRSLGARAVMLDIDNTLCPDGKFRCIDGVREWLSAFAEAGIPVTAVSNCTLPRMIPFALYLRLPFVHLAKKPKTRGLIKAAGRMGIDIHFIAMIGDGLFTDVTAANLCGALPVRTDPLPWNTTLYPRYYKRKQQAEEDFIKEHAELFAAVPYYGAQTTMPPFTPMT